MIFERVAGLLSKQLSVEKEKIHENTDVINDLNADSIDVLEMMMLLEEEFELTISDDEAKSIRTVSDIVNFIEKNN